MTVPLGFLLPVLTRRRSLRAVLTAGLATSLGIEVTQYICLRLLSSGRSSDVNDVIANVTGVAIGYAVYRVVAAWQLNSQRTSTDPTARRMTDRGSLRRRAGEVR